MSQVRAFWLRVFDGIQKEGWPLQPVILRSLGRGIEGAEWYDGKGPSFLLGAKAILKANWE